MTMTTPQAATDSAASLMPKRHRHEVRVRTLQVKRVTALSPGMIRITLTGPELEGFVSLGFDDHVKMFFAEPGEDRPRLPRVGAAGIEMPEGQSWPPMRDYTPRRYDAAAGELDIDFALHGEGPASGWAEAAKVGDETWIAGPRGSFVVPFAFDCHLLIADDTGLPAVARRLEELPAGTRAVALIEVEGEGERLDLATAADADIRWVYRNGAQPGDPGPLRAALAGLPRPQGNFHSWIGCESLVAKELRAQLIADFAANPKWLRASGYWRRGAMGVHDHFDE